MSESVPQRIGDAERDRAAEYLREHLAQGRLTQSEFDERIDLALRARTAADLEPLFVDLPAPRPGNSAPGASSTSTWPIFDPAGASVAVPDAVTSAALADLASERRLARGLSIAAIVAWCAYPVLLTVTGTWGTLWWLFFVPMVISSVAGDRQKRVNDREKQLERRDRQRQIDE